jgi:hypothetical protein
MLPQTSMRHPSILADGARAERPSAVHLLPITPCDPRTQHRAGCRAEANAPADPAVVRDVLGLTLGEARVASLVGSGLPLSRAAEHWAFRKE